MLSRTMTTMGALGLTAMISVPAGAQSTEATESVVNRGRSPLELVVEFPDRQVTGVTVSEDGRVFVCFPLWQPDYYDGAVAEVKDGKLSPYPNKEWNAWRLDSDLDPSEHFVCVQSVVADKEGALWVLDPAAPKMEDVVENGPKLVKINLESNEIEKTYPFDKNVAPKGSYLNDVRVDTGRGFAYITDSGKGALIVLKLDDGKAHRVLEGHPSTSATDVTPVIGGRPLKTPDGEVPQIHSDGIALDPAGEYLYWHPLVGYHTYRISTYDLQQLRKQPKKLAEKVEDLGPDVITDGMIMDADGDLYYTAIEFDGIIRRIDGRGHLKPVLIDQRLSWPDTLAIGPEGHLYITVSRIHEMPRFTGEKVGKPYALYRVDLSLDEAGETEEEDLSVLEKAIKEAREKAGVDR